jgi:hypothetical protein
MVLAAAVEFEQELDRRFAWQLQGAVAVRRGDSVEHLAAVSARSTRSPIEFTFREASSAVGMTAR